MEKHCFPQDELLNNNVLFSSYIESREKTALQKIIKSSSRKASHISDSQVSPRIYTNHSETVNSMLSAKKVTLGYSKKKDISQSHFVKYVWKSTVGHQSLEIERAWTNQSAEYGLSEKAQDLAILAEVWYQWTYEDRMKFIKFVSSLGKNDIDNQKIIDTINWGNKGSDLQLAKQNLSMKLSECLPDVLLAETIEEKAINLLNHLPALVLLPTTQVTAENEKSYLAGGRSTQETCKAISARPLVKCSCKGFRYSNICSHSVVFSEKGRILNSHIAKFKSHRSWASIT